MSAAHRRPDPTPDTVMAAAMARAGIRPGDVRLRALAARCLKGGPRHALRDFLEAVLQDPALICALVGEDMIEKHAELLLDETAGSAGKEMEGGGQPGRAIDGQSMHAAAFQTDDETGRRRAAHKAKRQVPVSSPQDRAGGHSSNASEADEPLPPARPPRHDGPGHGSYARMPSAVVPRRPNPARGLAAMAAAQVPLARSVMDSFRLRDGRAIGDVCWGEINSLIVENGREARVLRAVRLHIAEAPADALVRDIVRASVIEAALAEVPENV